MGHCYSKPSINRRVVQASSASPSRKPRSKMKFSKTIFIVGVWVCFESILAAGDVGTATSYDPPYLPTRCRGYSEDQFPEGGYFVAASEGIWDNGAACGRKYRLRCISGLKRPCKDHAIVVQVVDLCRGNPCPSTLVLSDKAFSAISNLPAAKINVEFVQI